ncbi:effector-associated constant component EACC1 [Streptomyces luteogriseus]|uniref:effector-associated constant component EACC1 n=1 Tax=Streptomyces luteogriseus TaxID=68233 RepID=UPI00262ED636|nr:hypothetical protein [Streptomyces luteogriseus]WTJ29834.1 hypothetical protein OID52_23690 [Streptomyces luteogriseus]
MSIRIDIAGDDTALPDLREWLSNERDLRGRLRQRTKPAQPGTMGSGTELVIQLSDLGLAGVNTVIAAITAWLAYRQRQPRAARTTVTVTAPDGTPYDISGADPAVLAHVAVEIAERLRGDDDPAA